MADKDGDINMIASNAAEKRLKQENRTHSTRTVTLDKDGDDRNLEDMEYMQNDDNIDRNTQEDIKDYSDYLNGEKDAAVENGDNKADEQERFDDAEKGVDKNDISRKKDKKSDRSRNNKSLNNYKRNAPKPRKDDAVQKNGRTLGGRDKSPNKYNKQEQRKTTKNESVSKSLKPVGRNSRKPLDSTNTREQPKAEQSKSLEEDDEFKEEFDELLAEQGYRYNDDDGRFDMIDNGGDWEESENETPENDQSEIPVLHDDGDEYLDNERPFTDTMRNYYASFRRYEGENDAIQINYRDPAHKKVGRNNGALVRFFRNGDPNFKGYTITINKKSFVNLDALLVFLTEKITTPSGVNYIFKWPEGKLIQSITDFRNRCVYIVSSTCSLNTKVKKYGESREGHWSNKSLSAGRRRNELDLYKRPISPKDSPSRNSPLVITIINNLSRDKQEKVILNPNTLQTFEEWLEDITNPDMPIRALFSEKRPEQEIKSFSQLFRAYKTQSTFIACGDELVPVEISKKRQATSSNSSTDSMSESRGRKKRLAKQNEMGQIYENGHSETPTSIPMSRYDTGPRHPMYGMRGRLESRRNPQDRVEIEIDNSIREFYPPTYVDPLDDGVKPERSLKCEWVYGFRGKDSFQDLVVIPTGELVYHVAAIVVLYDKERDTQRHYMAHNEEITCMTLLPKREKKNKKDPETILIATGQMHGKGPENASHIRIWDAVSLSTFSVIGLGIFNGGILSIGFSLDGIGNSMCVLDGSEKHVLSVWDWKSERIIARTAALDYVKDVTTSTDPVHCATFYPDDGNNCLLITYGVKHIYFWKIFYDVARKKEAKIFRDRNSGIFEDEVPQSINCLVFLDNGDVLTGDTSGNMMIWDRDKTDTFKCKFVIQAHSGTVMSMCLLDDGTLLSASGSEIKAWDTECNFRAVKTRTIPQEAGKIRSLITQTEGGIDGKLYVGTSHNAILDGSLQLKFRYVVQGHSDGVQGVVPHPYEPTFISAGFDQVVFKWSLVNHKVIWRAQVEAPCTAIAIDHRQELIAIGTCDGTFIVLNSYNGMHIATVEVGTESVGCLAFSPDGALLALGCSDGLISVFAIHDRGQTYRKFNMALQGHNSGVSKLDWSRDGRCLQSVSMNHELLFWDIDSMQMIKIPRMMRDVEWFTNTCHVAYNLIGPWTNLEKDETLKVVNRSNYRDLLITGDTRGRIRLYKYPCSKERAEFRGTRVYSCGVTAVAFTPHNSHVLSCGGWDAALIQWRLVDE